MSKSTRATLYLALFFASYGAGIAAMYPMMKEPSLGMRCVVILWAFVGITHGLKGFFEVREDES